MLIICKPLANERSGEEYLTHAAGEGLAAIAHALLGSFPSRRSPQVWLEVQSDQSDVRTTQIRADQIVGARVRQAVSEEEKYVLEVLAPDVTAPGRWLAVAEGTGDWFELNASQELLNLLEETARGDEPHSPVVVLRVFGQSEDKYELNYE